MGTCLSGEVARLRVKFQSEWDIRLANPGSPVCSQPKGRQGFWGWASHPKSDGANSERQKTVQTGHSRLSPSPLISKEQKSKKKKKHILEGPRVSHPSFCNFAVKCIYLCFSAVFLVLTLPHLTCSQTFCQTFHSL